MTQIDEPENVNSLLGEVLLRRDFPQGTISRQDGFELPNLKNLAERFVNRISRSDNKEKPLGWFLIFHGVDLNVDEITGQTTEEDWRANYISQVRVEELYMTMQDDEGRSLDFDENWLVTLASARGILDLDRLIDEDTKEYVKPSTVRLHHYQYATNYADAQYAASNPTKLGIANVGSNPGYGVGVIKGYRQNLRAAYMDYYTILQIHQAYTLNAESHQVVDPIPNIRFIFTGAEINYGEMVSPSFQQERFKDWINEPEGLDPSVCSTLKIESVYRTDDDNGLVRYASGALYPRVSAEDGIGHLSLPGLFILQSCRRFWEVVAKIQSAIVPTEEIILETREIIEARANKKLNKKAQKKADDNFKKQVAISNKKKSACIKVAKGLGGSALRGLIEKGQSLKI